MKKFLPHFLLKPKFWKRILLIAIVIPVIAFTVLVGIVYNRQDNIVQHLIEDMNADFEGSLEIKDSHISLFAAFPYISIDLEEVKIFENKEKNTVPIADVHDIYLGFDFWTVVKGDMEIKKLKLSDGTLNLVQHIDGSFNIVNALSETHEIEDPNEEFHLDLKEIELDRIDLTKLNEANNILIDAYVTEAISKFKTSPDHVMTSLDSRFELNLIVDGDTSFIKHKHFEVDTEIDFVNETELMTIAPTIVKLEGAEFNFEGTIDFLKDMYLDLKMNGTKPNFDLFIAMAPEELVPTLKRYENKGEIFFEAIIKGRSINGHNPFIDATFGCRDAFLNNYQVNKKLDELNFVGHFTNGEKRNPSTMEFSVKDFSARPEAGIFTGNLIVKNFDTPDIELQLKSDFRLEFLAKFFNIEGLEDLDGKIQLTMNFHDIIDLEYPEKSIEKLNESYFTQLKIEDLTFKTEQYAIPVKDIDLYAEMNGHEAHIDYFDIKIGNSDLSIKGSVSDLPAIIHHTSIPVETKLAISSKYLDLFELTGSDPQKSFDEQIKDLSMDFRFTSSAKAFTESPHLPIGEFFVENLYADLKHYPHTLHDFHADIFIEEEDFRLIDFTGMIDKSDFHFSGVLEHYDLWFMEHPKGDTKIDFNLVSKMLQLEDVFAYKGDNYVPEDYRHEEFDDLKIHGYVDMHFKDGLHSIDLNLDKFEAKMKVHPLRFEDFKGRVHYEDKHLVVENFSGKLGKSDFRTTLHYYLGDDEAVKKRDNHFELVATHFDLDELLNYHPLPSDEKVDHDAGFNIYEVPFTDMTYHFNIGHLNYHRYLIDNFDAELRTTPKHYLYVDKMHMEAAGGSFDISGAYFNGSNPDKIYFSPNMTVKNVDLDKLLFKFENFGQDHVVSENLHGKFSGKITGKVHVHNDLVPIIDDSEIHMDVVILNGRLENYAPLVDLADYFGDKNISKVRFDTLANHIDMTKGVMTIPNMTINSSIGFMQFSGKQDTDLVMEYYVRVPWKVVTRAAASKLFGKKPEEVDPDQVDAIEYADPEKRIRYLNLKITGTPDDYNITLGKDKKK